jgi:UTP--glucose-1-phosphate uridylyltransferase
MTQKTITIAVIPAAGLGSRFLPVTKNIPKELLPLVNVSCLQNVIDEAVASGVTDIILIISKEKHIIEDYFRPHAGLDKWLLKRGQTDLHAQLKAIETKANYHFVYQEEPLGLGHAVLQAHKLVTEDYFFVILPDDIVDAEIPLCQQMIQVFGETGKPLVSVTDVPWDSVHRYGIVQANPLSEHIGEIQSIIEKPKREKAPSNLAVIGRYLLPKTIFPLIEKTQPGRDEEIQLTDALNDLVGLTGLQAYSFSGERHDTGNPLGLLKASLALALKNPLFEKDLKDHIKMLAPTL